MNTSTSNLLQPDCVKTVNTARNPEFANLNDVESIVLFVGTPHGDMLSSDNNLRFIVMKNVRDAIRAIDQLQHVVRKLPSAIIYHWDSGNKTTMADWQSFFSAHNFLSSIPFFVYVESGVEDARSMAAAYNFIDDVISPNALPMLRHKIAITGKIKRLRVHPMLRTAKKTGMPVYKGKLLGNILKRSLDILAASIGLLLLSPLMLLIAILIRLESKGPIFYAAKRAGKNYRIFKFYKFRTMIPDADKQLNKIKHLNQYNENSGGPVFYKVSNDPRVTRLGSFLRNSSLDELPQLLNVLVGDMSLVGNRPLPLYEATSLTTDDWAERFLAPAGITGLWQVSKRGKKEMSVQERIDLDIKYAHERSFRYDMWLIVNTPRALVQKDNV
jgi:lipopolysaccharide/colanic/teichoic acid biosynthesis glycosyltransferase